MRLVYSWSMSKPAPLPLERYPLRAMDTVRYADTDRQGHVNNAVFATFCETGRTQFLYDPQRRLRPPGTEFVIARLQIDYLAEITWPGQVEIGSGITRIGQSSFTFAQAIFQAGKCVATAETVIVLMDETTRRSRPLPDAIRAVLAERQVAARHD
jgi:acyl-CoA thioester hydrolase